MEDNDKSYEIETILDHKQGRLSKKSNLEMLLKIKWQGLSAEEASWEPFKEIFNDSESTVLEYMRKNKLVRNGDFLRLIDG